MTVTVIIFLIKKLLIVVGGRREHRSEASILSFQRRPRLVSLALDGRAGAARDRRTQRIASGYAGGRDRPGTGRVLLFP